MAALASFDAVVLQALKETEQALALYRAEIDHRQALSEAQNRAQKAFEIAKGQYLAGGERPRPAHHGATAHRDRLGGSRIGCRPHQDQIAVFKALGGGWHNPETAAKR